MLDLVILTIDDDSQSQRSIGSEIHVPALPESSSCSTARVLKRKASHVSVDSQGWPNLLSGPPAPMSPEPVGNADLDFDNAPDNTAMAALMGYANSPTKASPPEQDADADDESATLASVLGYRSGPSTRPQGKAKAAATAAAKAVPQAKAKAQPKAQPKAKPHVTAPTVLDPESERDQLFTSDGEAEHFLFCKPKVNKPAQKTKVKLDTYGAAKADFEVKEPEGNWQTSVARHDALQVMSVVEVRRRRFEKLRPDLFRMVDGKWVPIDLGDIE